MARTATTANALLGLLALRREWTTWEVTTQLRRNMRFFWPRAESRILAELRRLDGEGLVRTRREAVGRRPRTVYTITAKGRRRLAEWIESPPRATTLESEPLLRLMLGELGSPDAMRRALDRVERDAEEILQVARPIAAEYAAGTAPFQDQVHVRAFVFDYLATHATGLLGWVQRTRTALDEWPTLDDDERAARAVARIVAGAAELPQPASGGDGAGRPPRDGHPRGVRR
jgi:PadR family transcriptional regulator, regulatory protein AphA